MKKLTYTQTLKLALAITETKDDAEQIIGIIALVKHGDEQAIKDGKIKIEDLKKLVENLHTIHR